MAHSTTHLLARQHSRPLSQHCPVYSLLITQHEAGTALSSAYVTAQPTHVPTGQLAGNADDLQQQLQ